MVLSFEFLSVVFVFGSSAGADIRVVRQVLRRPFEISARVHFAHQ